MTTKRIATETALEGATGQPAIDEGLRQKIDSFRAELQERTENRRCAKLSINIDASKLTNVDLPLSGENSSIDKERATALRRNLEATVERVKKLPNDLEFSPGVTLIVGDNGHGKSTFAKAIHLILKQQQLTESLQATAADMIDIGMGDEKFFDASAKEARDQIFHPKKTDTHNRLNLTQAGLAPTISQAVTLREADFFSLPDYIDCAKIAGEKLTRETKRVEQDFDGAIDERSRTRWEENRGRPSGNLDFTVKGDEIHQSSRQTIDEAVRQALKDFGVVGEDEDTKERQKKASIIFIDQPEEGADPKRQRQLQKELTSIAEGQGSIVIVPTNSILLCDSDLPRIDLENPERGIFRPSEYPAS